MSRQSSQKRRKDAGAKDGAKARRARSKRSKLAGSKRRNPELLTLFKNPATRAQIERALLLSERFHRVKPKHLLQVQGDGPPLIALGKATHVDYLPTRGARAKGPMFRHPFKHTVLACTADGRELRFVTVKGKPYHVDFERGVIGG